MTSLAFCNDVHIGAIRAGGTTPATAWQLRQDLLANFEEMLYGVQSDLLIGGDLFDGPAIPQADLLRTFQVLSDWLNRTGKHLYASSGNHDLSRSSQVLSSFQLMMKLLIEVFGPERVTHIEGGLMTPHGYVISHVPNQDLFDLELTKVPECEYLYLHVNYDNQFAVESDHSLNLSKEWAQKLPVKHIVIAHEHQARTELKGKVVIVGNQFPSSISDCLHNSTKHRIDVTPGRITEVETWKAEGDFSEQDWRDLKDEGRFIRVTGNATAAEAAIVAQGISRFRQQAKALVITNAVKIEGTDDAEVLALSHEEVTAFNVEAALMELLDESEQIKVQALLHPAPRAETHPVIEAYLKENENAQAN